MKSELNSSDSILLTNAMYLTNKGNIIVMVLDEPTDTMSFYWGKYSFKDSILNYRLTDEFYYPGLWDEANPDFTKGKTRKRISEEINLRKSESDSLFFYRLITSNEKLVSVGNRTELIPQKIIYSPYYEGENEKFITWKFKAIPELAEL